MTREEEEKRYLNRLFITFFSTSFAPLSGLILRDGSVLPADLVVMAPGHSARVLYEKLLDKGVCLEPKPIAVRYPLKSSLHLILFVMRMTSDIFIFFLLKFLDMDRVSSSIVDSTFLTYFHSLSTLLISIPLIISISMFSFSPYFLLPYFLLPLFSPVL